MHLLLLLLQVMCFPSNHLAKLKDSTRSSRRLKRLHDLLDIDITMDTYESWPYDLQQVRFFTAGSCQKWLCSPACLALSSLQHMHVAL
jgi:hypothetical protein